MQEVFKSQLVTIILAIHVMIHTFQQLQFMANQVSELNN